ncbi:MAG: hypothetical protein Q9201_001459 [Fulgogasparrea decipioides]
MDGTTSTFTHRLPLEIRILVYKHTLAVDEEDISEYGTKGPKTLQNAAMVSRQLRQEALPVLYGKGLSPIRISGSTMNFLGKELRCTDLIRFTPPRNVALMRKWVVIVEEDWMYETDPETQAKLRSIAMSAPNAGLTNTNALYNATHQQGEKERLMRVKWNMKSLHWVLIQLEEAAAAPLDLIVRLHKSRQGIVDHCQSQPLKIISQPGNNPREMIDYKVSLLHGLERLWRPRVEIKVTPSLEGHLHPNLSEALVQLPRDLSEKGQSSLFKLFQETVIICKLRMHRPSILQKVWSDLFTAAEPFYDRSSTLKRLVYEAWQYIDVDDNASGQAILNTVECLVDVLAANEDMRWRFENNQNIIAYMVAASSFEPGDRECLATSFRMGVAISERIERGRHRPIKLGNRILGSHTVFVDED